MTKTSPKIVVNYRRSDSRASAGRLATASKAEFRHVFIDISDIEAGEDYPQASLAAVKECDVLLVVIGENWLDPRLHDPKDLVRREIETAFEEKKRVIPVLVDNADLPASRDLPPSLTALPRHNAVRLRHATWEQDLEGLVKKLRRCKRGSRGTARTKLFWRWKLAAQALLILFILCSFVLLSLGDITPGYRRKLLPSPRWPDSGAWVDEYTLALVDAQRRVVFYSSRTGQSEGNLDHLRLTPERVQAVGDGLVVETVDGVLDWLDKSSRVLRRFVLTAPQGREGLSFLPQWEIVGNEVLAFSDIYLLRGDWTSGFVRIPLDSPKSFDLLHPVETSSEEHRFYFLGYPFVAKAGGKGYFLIMDSNPRICEMPPRHQKEVVCLKETPKGLLRRAKLPKDKGKESTVKLFDAFEESCSTAGLYGWGDALYVLNRCPAERTEGTNWTLSRIDRHTGRTPYTKELGTHAAHLTIIPGPKLWAIIERGTVTGFGEQQVPFSYFVPSSYFEKPSGSITQGRGMK